MLPLPGLASSRPTGVVRLRATATVATVAGWLRENSRRGPLTRTRASFGMPPAVAGLAAASAGLAADVAAPGVAAAVGAAGPAAGAAGAGGGAGGGGGGRRRAGGGRGGGGGGPRRGRGGGGRHGDGALHAGVPHADVREHASRGERVLERPGGLRAGVEGLRGRGRR